MVSNPSLDQICETLKSVNLFHEFVNDTEKLKVIAQCFYIKKYKANEKIFNEGDEGDELFIIHKGKVEILKRTLENDTYTVVTLGQNAFFGELALLDSDNRSATVISITESEFFVINRFNFEKLGNAHPYIGLIISRNIAKFLSKRLRKASSDIILLFEALVNEVEGTVQ